MSDELGSARERYTRQQVRRILRLSEKQLRAWERQGLVQPSRVLEMLPAENSANETEDIPAPKGAGRVKRGKSEDCYYTFSDLVTLRTLLQLVNSGVPQSQLRLAHAALRRKLTEVEKPWSQLQIKGRGKNVVVMFQGASLEPVSGQFLLEYATQTADDGTRLRTFNQVGQRKDRTVAEKREIAERFFLAGLRCEETGGPTEKAVQAYQKAIEINPEAVGAFINLGTIFYNLSQLDEAEKCYRSALSVDPGYALVHFNLGNVADEKNDFHNARAHYEDAIRRDPGYPDPHYNLALVYEKLGLHGKARQQWLRYLKLDQQSHWASYARMQLERTPLRIIRPEERSENMS